MKTFREILLSPDIQRIEFEIITDYNYEDYLAQGCSKLKSLLDIRKEFIEDKVLKYQEELLPEIIEFNEALRLALLRMYNKAHDTWTNFQQVVCNPDDEVELCAKCYLGREYPTRHPLQGEERQDLWNALCDTDLNPLYAKGVSAQILILPSDDTEAFESFIGLNCGNWNERLDRELTKELHLISQFHHLYDHTYWAITDFIYVRDFEIDINIFMKNLISNQNTSM